MERCAVISLTILFCGPLWLPKDKEISHLLNRRKIVRQENYENNVAPRFFRWGLLSRVGKGLSSDGILRSKNGISL